MNGISILIDKNSGIGARIVLLKLGAVIVGS